MDGIERRGSLPAHGCRRRDNLLRTFAEFLHALLQCLWGATSFMDRSRNCCSGFRSIFYGYPTDFASLAEGTLEVKWNSTFEMIKSADTSGGYSSGYVFSLMAHARRRSASGLISRPTN